MQCPKCGHEQANTVECESCGIVFAKYRQRQETQSEFDAIRTPGQTAKHPPYKIIGIAAAFLLLILIIVMTGGDDVAEDEPVAATAAPEASVAEETQEPADDTRYLRYKRLTNYALDHTLLRFQPGITNEYIDEFNFNWIRAYNCEYSAEIQKDKSRFYEVMRKVMDAELRYRYDYPNKFQHSGDLSVKLVSATGNEVKVRPYVRVQGYRGAAREKDGPGCQATRNMNTRHIIQFAPLRKDLSIEVPRRILEALDHPERGFELEAEVKFRIEGSRYEYLRSQRAFRVYNKAVVEELDILNNDNAPRSERIFMNLNESQLY